MIGMLVRRTRSTVSLRGKSANIARGKMWMNAELIGEKRLWQGYALRVRISRDTVLRVLHRTKKWARSKRMVRTIGPNQEVA